MRFSQGAQGVGGMAGKIVHGFISRQRALTFGRICWLALAALFIARESAIHCMLMVVFSRINRAMATFRASLPTAQPASTAASQDSRVHSQSSLRKPPKRMEKGAPILLI